MSKPNSATLTRTDVAEVTPHVGALVKFTLCVGDRTHYGRVSTVSANGRMLKVETWVGYFDWVFVEECAVVMPTNGDDWRERVREWTMREFERIGEKFED